jgi:hypothetical protein
LINKEWQMQFRARFAAVGAALSMLVGCAQMVIPGRLYDMNSGTVLQGAFVWQGTTSGPTTITKADEACTGEYRTIVQGQTTTASGVGVNGWGRLFSTMYSTSTVERAQKGMALAICPSGQTFECEYITNVRLSGVDGHGVCRDNKGGNYRLMF